MRPWTTGQERGHKTLTIANRYYSSRSEQSDQNIVPFGDLIDPLQVLQTAVPSATHTADNQVLYFERSCSLDK